MAPSPTSQRSSPLSEVASSPSPTTEDQVDDQDRPIRSGSHVASGSRSPLSEIRSRRSDRSPTSSTVTALTVLSGDESDNESETRRAAYQAEEEGEEQAGAMLNNDAAARRISPIKPQIQQNSDRVS